MVKCEMCNVRGRERVCVCTHLAFSVHVYNNEVSTCNYPHSAFCTVSILYYINPHPYPWGLKKEENILKLPLYYVGLDSLSLILSLCSTTTSV